MLMSQGTARGPGPYMVPGESHMKVIHQRPAPRTIRLAAIPIFAVLVAGICFRQRRRFTPLEAIGETRSRDDLPPTMRNRCVRCDVPEGVQRIRFQHRDGRPESDQPLGEGP